MRHIIRKIAMFIISVSICLDALCNMSACNIAYATETIADFEIDPELWRCMLESNQFNCDSNKDGVVTKEEFGSVHGLVIDCEGYDIKDWSGLKYGTEWQIVSVKNCLGGDFSALAELDRLWGVYIKDVSDFSKISGLDKIEGLNHLEISSTSEIDLSVFKDYPGLSGLYVDAEKFTNYESLADIADLSVLSLRGDSIENIEKLPELPNLFTLMLSFPELDDSLISDIAKKCPNIYDVKVNESAITNLDWLLEFSLENLMHVYVDNNQITDISALEEVLNRENCRLQVINIGRNPLTEESKIKLVEYGLAVVNPLVLEVNSAKILYDKWKLVIDEVNFNNVRFEVADTEIAEIEDDRIIAKAVGKTALKIINGDVQFEYEVHVVEIPTETTAPKPTETPEPSDEPAETPTLEPTETPEPTESGELELAIGDVDGNGVIDAADALLVLKASAKLVQLTEEEQLLAYVNDDVIIDAEDALEILKYAATLIKDFN